MSAFKIAERAERSKIIDWASRFEFDLADAVIIDLACEREAEELVAEILAAVERSGSDGAVAASTEYLKRAKIASHLTDALRKAGKNIWIASLGSLPLDERVIA